MRHPLLAIPAALLVISACKESVAPEAPLVRILATVTEANTCAVTTLGKSYSSVGQIKGDVPARFVGTLAGEPYHGFACWVSTSGGDGSLTVIFSGNNIGKPLAPGTYSLRQDLLFDTPPGMASVSFYTSTLGSHRLKTLDNANGSVIVEETASGGRIIRVDVDAVEYGPIF